MRVLSIAVDEDQKDASGYCRTVTAMLLLW